MQQGGGMHQDWRITGEDRAKHDAQFNQLKPVNGFISGEAARGFFLQSGLPQQVLGHIWTLSDINADGKLDKLEFSIAMYLIKRKLTGTELPRNLPASLKQAPAPVMGSFGPQAAIGMVGGFGAMPGMQMGMPVGSIGVTPGGFNTMPGRSAGIGGFGGLPAQQGVPARPGSVQASPERSRSSSVTSDWGVPHYSKLKYTQLFNTTDRTRSGFLTGAQARTVLVQSGLAQGHLAQIWGLADVDNDGKLTCEEFCLAMHLVDMVKTGKPLPQALAPDLVPPSYRKGRSSSLSAGVPPTPAPAPAMPTPSMMASMSGAGGFGSPAPLGGAVPVSMAAPASLSGALGGALLSGGGMPGMAAPGGGLGAMGAPLSPAMAPAMVNQQNVDEPPQAGEEEKKFTPVSFEDRKRQNFEKGQQELERRRAALREVQEREKERQREIEKQEQERKERIRMEQERRRQLEFERQLQKQREIEAEREAQRRKLEEQREAARRELERQRQLELERQKRQELEAKRIKSQEEVCHLKATNKTLACEIETLEDKKNELNKKLSETGSYLKEHQTSIILMGHNRDAKVAEIDQLQQKIQELRHLKQQRAQQKEDLQDQAKKLNINLHVSDTYAAVMTSYSNKKKTLEKLREALQEVERKTATRLQDTDNGNSRLSELKATLAREENETDHLQKQYQVKMAEYNSTRKSVDDSKNLQNEKIKQETMRKTKEEEEKKSRFDAIRLAQQQADKQRETTEKRRKEEEEKKRKEQEEKAKSATKSDPFGAFGSSSSDPFASAFGSNAASSTPPSDPSDPFAAFSGGSSVQSSKSNSEKKDPFAAFGEFSNSTFDFGQGFSAQSSKAVIPSTTSSSSISSMTATPSTTGSSASTLATPTPQPRSAPTPTTGKTSAIAPAMQKLPYAAESASAGGKANSTSGSPTILPSELKTVLSQYKALYQFDAEGPDELSIKPGDIILVGKNQTGEPGWLGGECNGRTGWFPENYAEKMHSPPPSPSKKAVEPKSESAVNASGGDSLGWASFGGIQKTEEVKQQSAPVKSQSPTPAPAPSQTQIAAKTSIPAPTASSTPPAPSPVPAPSIKQLSTTIPPVSSSPAPIPESVQPKSSVSALAAAFTAAAEASTVPQVSTPKPIKEETVDERSKVTVAAETEEQVYDVLGEKPKPAAAATEDGAASPFAKVTPQTGQPASTPSPIPNQGTKPPEGTKVKALYDWKAKKENHLSFIAGEMITVLEKQDMWWMGELEGRQGWFPKAHVQFMEVEGPVPDNGSQAASQNDSGAFALYANTPKVQPEVSAFALYANTPKVTKQPSPIPQQQPPAQQTAPSIAAAITATTSSSPLPKPVENSVATEQGTTGSLKEECTALYAYSSDEPGDLTFEAGDHITVTFKDGDWWTGQVGGREGIFPSNYVQVTQPAAPAPDGQNAPLAPAAPTIIPADTAAKTGSLSKKPEIARVIAAYEATGAEQLSLTIGQLIMVRKKNPSGWWEGELQARGKKRQIGWFPANYVKLMDSGGVPGVKGPSKEPPESPSVLTPPKSANQRLTPGLDIVCQVITLYPYIKQNDDELNFQKGMVINVVNKDNPDWWRGELNGSEGVFPSNYVQELGDSKSAPATDWTHDVHLLESMSDTEQYRQSRIHELIQTEQAYVDDMQLVVEVFQKPILESGMMSSQEMASVFVNWKELIQCNTKLLKALRVRKKMSGEDQPVNKIGDILCEQLPRMTPYIRFCSCQLSASSILSKKIEGDPDFKDSVKRLGTDVRTKGMPVSSYLIKPMQRITKYPLLIQKILKYTPETHADYAYIKSATEKAEELCQQVNEGVREKENSDRLEWLQTHVDCTGLAEELIFNSLTNCLGPRKYMHSGRLNKAKSNKELYVFLFNDFLLFTQPVKSGLAPPFTSTDSKTINEYKMYKHPLFLNEVEVKVPADAAPDDFVFHINHIDKVYALRGESNNDRNRWKEKIEKASKNYIDTEKKKREKLQRVRSQRSKGVGRLMVVIIEGYDLKPSNSVTGRSDPYCDVSMGSQEHKTKVVPDNLNPVWDASMQFIIRDLQEDVLCITVYDRDFFSPNDFLGRTEVRVADILKETHGRGPVTKRMLLHEVSTGEIKVKLTLHLFDQS